MFSQIIAGKSLPEHLSSDHDPLFRFHRWLANLRILDGPSWLSFIGHIKDSLWSVDLFRCESILLRSHWVMVVMDVFTRRIIGFGVER
jgi:hypothetical protein